MSQEDVEVVSASIAAYNAADIDAQMATYLPTAVAITHINRETRLPDASDRMEGREEIRHWVLDGFQSWRPRMRPRKFGRSATDACCAEAVRDGKVTKIEWFFDHAEALEAVGLSEQDAHADS